MEETRAPQLISVHEGYARFAPAGPGTVGSLAAVLEHVMQECQTFAQTRLLVNVRSLDFPSLSAVDRYELSETVAGFWDRSILLAMVARADQIDPERFGQKVAVNRGLFVAVFTDEVPAVEWLRSRRTVGLSRSPPRPD